MLYENVSWNLLYTWLEYVKKFAFSIIKETSLAILSFNIKSVGWSKSLVTLLADRSVIWVVW